MGTLKFDIVGCTSGFSRLARCAEHYQHMVEDKASERPIGEGEPPAGEDVAALLDCPLVDDEYLSRAFGLSRSQRAEFTARYGRLPVAERPALSPFFDAAWYLSQYEDLRRAGIDPFLHFIEHGIFELRSPHPLISMRRIYDDNRALFYREGGCRSLLRVLCENLSDPSDHFDVKFYLDQYPKARQHEGGALAHFLEKGKSEWLQPNAGFDTEWYAERYPDLPRDSVAVLRHFIDPAAASVDPQSHWRAPSQPAAGRTFLGQTAGQGGAAASEDGNALEAPQDKPITVLILSWNRPIYLWACLDSLYRYTRRPARFILIDNHSDDPLVRNVIRGFERRGMFYDVEWAEFNSERTLFRALHRYRSLFGEYFVYIESDTVVFDTEPCWLSRLSALMDAHPNLGMLGSYIDGRDYVDPLRAAEIAPSMDPKRRSRLIKEEDPERGLPLIAPKQGIIDPFNPPGRLLMLRTRALDIAGLEHWEDHILYQRVKGAGMEAGIATDVRHRHLSSLDIFDYPEHPVGDDIWEKTIAHAQFARNR